jgi:hypothetical protein
LPQKFENIIFGIIVTTLWLTCTHVSHNAPRQGVASATSATLAVLVQQRSRALWPRQAGDCGRDGKEFQHWKFLKLGKQSKHITTYILTGFEQNPMLEIFVSR